MERMRQKLKWDTRSETFKTVFLLVIVVGGTLGGYGLFMLTMGTSSPLVVVTSGSMEPTYYRGDLLVLQSRAPEDIQLSDVIVFEDKNWETNGPVVHRVVEIGIIDGEYHFTTKGDNNNSEDPYTRTADEIIGVVVGVIPAIGHISLFLKEPIGMAFMIILFIAILVVPEYVCNEEEEEGATEDSDSSDDSSTDT